MLRYFFYNIKKHNEIWFKTPIVKNNKYSLCSLLLQSIKICIKSILKKDTINYMSSEVLFITISQNNHRVLDPIIEKMDKSNCSVIDINEPSLSPSIYFLNRLSCIYLPAFLAQYLRFSKEEKRICKNLFFEFFYTYAYMVYAERIIKMNNVKTIVMANDHASITRAFALQGHRYGVKTIYLQHCSIGYHFPPLIFDYSLLDGEESLEKYKRIGRMDSNVVLLGNPRYDIISSYREKLISTGLFGIAVNSFDEEKDLILLCKRLKESGFEGICVRPHPGQKLYSDWYLKNNILISDPKMENPFQFLSKLDCLIAGESGIHLEASLMGVVSVYYILSGKEAVDWYSYIKNQLIPYAKTLDELLTILKNHSQNMINSNLLKYYNASYGTIWDGRTAELVSEFIISCTDNKERQYLLDHFTESSLSESKSLYTYTGKSMLANS